MRRSIALVIVLMVFCWLPGCAFNAAADVYTPDSVENILTEHSEGPKWQGVLNWQEGYAQATGYGLADPQKAGNQTNAELMALKAGRYLAYAKLLELVQGIRLDYTTTWNERFAGNGQVQARVSGLVRGAAVVYQRNYLRNDGWVVGEVTVRLPLGKLGRAGGRAYMRAGPDNNILGAEPAKPVLAKQYTGLIINAGGLGARPALFPSVVSQGGAQEIFGPMVISQDEAVENGVVGYATSIAKARQNPRVGDNPLVVKAIRVQGKNKARLVISARDAQNLKRADENADFLGKCKVVIVIN